MLSGCGVVNFDLEASRIEVELFAVAGHAEAETGAAGELGGLGDAIGSQIEGPELAALVAMRAV